MPELKDKLTSDMKQAMRDREKVTLSVIRLVLAAVKNAEIAKRGELDDSDVLGILTKEARQRQESIEAYKKGNRDDLVAAEEAELAVLKGYLPEQASREEVVTAARLIIEETGASGPSDKGKVMPKLVAQFKGKADGRVINEVVTELLNA